MPKPLPPLSSGGDRPAAPASVAAGVRAGLALVRFPPSPERLLGFCEWGSSTEGEESGGTRGVGGAPRSADVRRTYGRRWQSRTVEHWDRCSGSFLWCRGRLRFPTLTVDGCPYSPLVA